jgi:hypothetical protein
MNPRVKMRGALLGAVVALTFGYTWQLVKAPVLEDKADRSMAQAQRANERTDQTEAQVNTLASNQQKLLKGLDEANRRLIALGKPPVAVPTVAPAQPTGLTAEQAAAVRLIVADQVSSQKVTITQAEISQIARVAAQMVPKPVDGKTPTTAQIQPMVTAAIAAYCTGDKCVGKTGPTGPQGDRGPEGKDAPKVTDEELLKAAQQALTAYCGQESSPCDGKVGPSGTDGEDAPVMVDMDCLGDGDASYWRMQFNKGPDKTAKGPCRIGPEPPE